MIFHIIRNMDTLSNAIYIEEAREEVSGEALAAASNRHWMGVYKNMWYNVTPAQRTRRPGVQATDKNCNHVQLQAIYTSTRGVIQQTNNRAQRQEHQAGVWRQRQGQELIEAAQEGVFLCLRSLLLSLSLLLCIVVVAEVEGRVAAEAARNRSLPETRGRVRTDPGTVSGSERGSTRDREGKQG